MKFKRVIAEILAAVLCINTLSISTLAENEAQTFIEVMEQEHIEPVVDQWGQNGSRAENSSEGVLSDADPAEVATGSVVNQWGEEAEILQPEEIVAAEAVEGEVAEAGAETAQAVLAGNTADGFVEDDLVYVDDGKAKTPFKDFLSAFNYISSNKIASSSVVLLQDASVQDSITIQYNSNAMCTTLNLNGYNISGIVDHQIFDIQKGTIVFDNLIVTLPDRTKIEGKISNTHDSGSIMNIGSNNPVVILNAGTFETKGVTLNAFGGELFVEPGKYPVINSLNSQVISKNKCSVSLAGGIYNNKPSVGIRNGYNAYYYSEKDYYVILEKHPIYMIVDGRDKGFDKFSEVVAFLAEHKPAITKPEIYLLEDYDAGVEGGGAITIPTGLDITLDLHGCALKGIASLTLQGNANYTIKDTVTGGSVVLPDKEIVVPGTSKLTLLGGTYKYSGDESRISGFVPATHKVVTIKAGAEYMVVPGGDMIAVVGKGSAPSFYDTVDGMGNTIPGAFTIADPGDTIILLNDYNLDDDVKFDASGNMIQAPQLSIKKAVTIDLNGHQLSSSYDYAVYVYESGASIVNTSSIPATIYGNHSGSTTTTYAVYVKNSASVSGQQSTDFVFTIDNVTIKAANKAGENSSCCLASEGKCTVKANDCVFEEIGTSGSVIKVLGGVVSTSGTKTVFSGSADGTKYGYKFEINSGAELSIDCDTSKYPSSEVKNISGVNSALEVYAHGTLSIEDGYFPCTVNLVRSSYDPGKVNIRGGLFGPRDGKTKFFGTGFDTYKEKVYIYGGNFDAESTPLGYFAPGCYQVQESVTGYSYTVGIGSAIKSHSVIIGDGLFLKVGIEKNPKLRQIVKDSDIKIKVTWLAEDGTAKKTDIYDINHARDEDKIENPTPVEDAQYNGYYVRIPFSPQNMTDGFIIEAESINKELQYPRQDWGVMIPEQVNTTVRAYTQKTYTKYPSKTAQNDAMATMLLFGAETQKYAEYKTEDLADNVVWLEAFRTKYTEMPSAPGFEHKGALFTGHSIDLGSQYAIKLYIDTTKLDKEKDYCVVVNYATHTAYFPKAGWKTMTDAQTNEKLTYALIPGIMYMNSHITYRARMQEGSFVDEKWVGTDVKDVSGATTDVESATTGVNRYLYDFCTAEEKKSAGSEALGYTAYRFGIYSNKFSTAGK